MAVAEGSSGAVAACQAEVKAVEAVMTVAHQVGYVVAMAQTAEARLEARGAEAEAEKLEAPVEEQLGWFHT